LDVCQAINIDSVEITQAIQQYQTLSALQTSLQTNGEPPVPIISGKPAVLRVYFQEVEDVTNVTVQLSGISTQSQNPQTIALQPNCADVDQRAHNNGCPSMDFYFTPPSGSWQATLDVLDSSGNVLQEQVLTVNSRDTNSLRLNAVSVCDAKDATGNWLCANASALLGNTTLLSKIAPTNTVALNITNDVVREDSATFPLDQNGNPTDWWFAAVNDVNALYGLFDSIGDFLADRYTTYFGQIRPQLPGSIGGMAHCTLQPNGSCVILPSHGAAAETSVIRLGTQTNTEVVAHETGHTLGLKHTNQAVPVAGASPPGCYSLARDPTTDWTFPNNYIQSTAQLEYGFDVAGQSVLNPMTTFEVMSYCVPRWISPQRYKTMITTLGGGTVTSPSDRRGPGTVTSSDSPPRLSALGGTVQSPSDRRGSETAPVTLTDSRSKLSPHTAASSSPSPFWQVRGVIINGAVQFSPLFQLTVQGDTTEESGTYSLIEQDASRNPLFTRFFTPEAPTTETAGSDVTANPAFSQLIPVNVTAASIVVDDPNGVQIGIISLGGVAPTVTLVSPGSGFVGSGTQTVSWTIQEPGVTSFTSRVLYSANGGATWSGLGDVVNGTSLPVDFDLLPGSNTGLIQVLVSDGVNTGTATSPLFTVPRKQNQPSVVEIDNPVPDSAWPAKNPVYLSGGAYDVDDGILTGPALQWTSNIQGPLGSGSPLSVHLQPGNHVITLTATDSGRNSASATTNITVGGQPPLVIVGTQALNVVPTTCESATITAQPGANGAPLSSVQYSLNGGASYTNIPLSSLPYKFIVPGSGFIHLVARAYDVSGQSNAADTTFFTASACQEGEPLVQGVVTSNGLQSPGVYAVTVTFTNIGAGLAQQPNLTISARRLSGTGTITYLGSNPISLPGLSPGQSTSVQLLFAVPNPNTITRFSVTESGTLLDAFNASETFSASQQIIP
jgi:hypothetical protein